MTGGYFGSVRPALRDSVAEDESAEQAARRVLVLVVLWALFLLYCAAVVFDWWPWLRGWGNFPQGWTWPAYQASIVDIIPVACIAAAIWVIVAISEFGYMVPLWVGGRRARGTLIALRYLVLMVVLGYVLQLGLLGLKTDNANRLLVERVTNRVFTGYYTLAASTSDPAAFFSDYPAVFSTQLCPHCSDHPPGPALFYWLNIQAASALPPYWQHNTASWIWGLVGDSPSVTQLRTRLSDAQIVGAFTGGTLILLLSSAVVIPLYGLARLLGPRNFEFRLAALGLALPGLMLMAPEFDQVFALLFATALYYAVRGLLAPTESNSWLWGAWAGVVIAIGLLFSWAFSSALLVLALLALAGAGTSRAVSPDGEAYFPSVPTSQLLAWGAGILAGVILPLALLMLATRVDLVYIFQYNLANDALTEAARPYLVWLFFGTLDYLQFLGLPLALAALLVVAVRTHRPPVVSWTGARLAPGEPRARVINGYALAFWLTVIAIEVAGRSKAEQGRTLIFLAPLALVAIYFWAGTGRVRAGYISQLFLAQMLVCMAIGARWFVP